MNRNSVVAELRVKQSKKRYEQEHYVGGQETARVVRVCEGSDPHKLTSWKSRVHVPRRPVSRAQLTRGLSLPEGATAHARPYSYMSSW